MAFPWSLPSSEISSICSGLSISNSCLLAIPEAIFEGHAVELVLPVTDQIMHTYELEVKSSKQLNDLYFSVVLGSGW